MRVVTEHLNYIVIGLKEIISKCVLHKRNNTIKMNLYLYEIH